MQAACVQDWRGKLGKDPQGRADNKAFAPREQQTLFDKYVKDLAIHIEQDFRALMEQVSMANRHWLCTALSYKAGSKVRSAGQASQLCGLGLPCAGVWLASRISAVLAVKQLATIRLLLQRGVAWYMHGQTSSVLRLSPVIDRTPFLMLSVQANRATFCQTSKTQASPSLHMQVVKYTKLREQGMYDGQCDAAEAETHASSRASGQDPPSTPCHI